MKARHRAVSLVLTVNEDREQTRAIHQLQRERQTLAGLLARQDRRAILQLHQNAQRLLKPLLVANPFARELTFLDTRTRTRRDHMKYLTLIRTLVLLYQYQRPVQIITHHGKTLDYIEVTRADIATANRLAHEVLGRSLDELSPQTRRLLHQLDQMVTEACTRLKIDRSGHRFSRRAPHHGECPAHRQDRARTVTAAPRHRDCMKSRARNTGRADDRRQSGSVLWVSWSVHLRTVRGAIRGCACVPGDRDGCP